MYLNKKSTSRIMVIKINTKNNESKYITTTFTFESKEEQKGFKEFCKDIGMTGSKFIRTAIKEKMDRMQNKDKYLDVSNIQKFLGQIMINQKDMSKEQKEQRQLIGEATSLRNNIMKLEEDITSIQDKGELNGAIKKFQEYCKSHKAFTPAQIAVDMRITKALARALVKKERDKGSIKYIPNSYGKYEVLDNE